MKKLKINQKRYAIVDSKGNIIERNRIKQIFRYKKLCKETIIKIKKDYFLEELHMEEI